MTPSIRQAMVGRARQFDALTPLTSILCCSRGQQVCCQGEPADRWFWIITGTARRSVIRRDGRRQIVDLLLPGDCFGFTNGDEYDDTVEAVARETYVARCIRRDAEAVAEIQSATGARNPPGDIRGLVATAVTTRDRRTDYGDREGRGVPARYVRARVLPLERSRCIAHFALRYGGLSRAIGRDGQPVADSSQAAGRDQALRSSVGGDRRPGGARVRRALAARRHDEE